MRERVHYKRVTLNLFGVEKQGIKLQIVILDRCLKHLSENMGQLGTE